MAKYYVEAIYRNVLVHPNHHILLGMKWRNQFYVDLVLPFGLRSAPFNFNFAAMVECIFVTTYQIPDLLHYLDDFITAGPAQSPQSVNSLVYHCILVSVWAPLQYSSWALISTPLTKWHVSPRRSCHRCKIQLVLDSLETGATDTSLNLLLDTCITLP